jgi:hypothetical protein
MFRSLYCKRLQLQCANLSALGSGTLKHVENVGLHRCLELAAKSAEVLLRRQRLRRHLQPCRAMRFRGVQRLHLKTATLLQASFSLSPDRVRHPLLAWFGKPDAFHRGACLILRHPQQVGVTVIKRSFTTPSRPTPRPEAAVS